MTEAYLIASWVAPLSDGAAVWESLARAANTSLRRVQEVHAFGDGLEGWLTAFPTHNDTAAIFSWRDEPLLAHALLHNAARAIETGERDLILFAQSYEGIGAALLLASPKSVGRDNLLPRARLGLRLSMAGMEDGLAELARRRLEETQVEIGWTAGVDAAPARRLETALPDADAFLLHALVERLEAEKAFAGLLVRVGARSALATVIERV